MENKEINFEQFINIKGIKAQGNQLTTEKIKQVNLLEPLPYDEPEEPAVEELDVVEEEVIVDHKTSEATNAPVETDKTENNGQITMF